MTSDCTLSITVAHTDADFMMHTIPHLVRTCRFPFAQCLLVVDTSPLQKSCSSPSCLKSYYRMRDCCRELQERGVVDRTVDIDFSDKSRKAAYNKHFGEDIGQTHDHRGTPILGFIFSVDCAEIETDYLVHFDSDMLLYQQKGYSWIDEGIDLLRSHQDVMFVLPMPGPPAEDGSLQKQGKEAYKKDPRGFYSFKKFTSRKFLMDRRRLDEMLPLKPIKAPLGRKVRRFARTRTKSALNAHTFVVWEDMVSERMSSTDYVRADLCSPKSWTVHPVDHGPGFVEALPRIIDKVEAGWYPPEQAGRYNLKLDKWL